LHGFLGALLRCNSLEWNNHSASLRLALHPKNHTLHPVQLRFLGLSIIFMLSLLGFVRGAWAAVPDGEAIYRKACSHCHDEGAVGSPRLGNQSFWKKRVQQGRRTLYRHAIEGFRNMPPRGGVAALTDEEVKAAVDYTIDKSNACPVLFLC
jgi:hypothetical protein